MKINENEIVYGPIIIYIKYKARKGGENNRKSINERQMLKESLKLQGKKRGERKECKIKISKA